MLEIVPLVLGPIATNCYLVGDPASAEAVVIDPAWDAATIVEAARVRGWKLTALWITHAHFDHFAAVPGLIKALGPGLPIALHPADRMLWEAGGLAGGLGIDLPPLPAPSVDLSVDWKLPVGAYTFIVRNAPGHSPGSCIFYCQAAGILFAGDLVFRLSVGRTDLPGGDWETLLESIRSLVYTLPGETRILPGHGPETQVGEERCKNPFVKT